MLIKYYNTVLLAELLLLNYEFVNYEYNNVTGNDVFKIVERKLYLSEQERQSMIDNAVLYLKIKYNIELKNFNTIKFET